MLMNIKIFQIRSTNKFFCYLKIKIHYFLIQINSTCHLFIGSNMGHERSNFSEVKIAINTEKKIHKFINPSTLTFLIFFKPSKS